LAGNEKAKESGLFERSTAPKTEGLGYDVLGSRTDKNIVEPLSLAHEEATYSQLVSCDNLALKLLVSHPKESEKQMSGSQ
jgi:hypothetical protein